MKTSILHNFPFPRLALLGSSPPPSALLSDFGKYTYCYRQGGRIGAPTTRIISGPVDFESTDSLIQEHRIPFCILTRRYHGSALSVLAFME